MGIVNFWIAYSDDDMLAQVESLLPPQPGVTRDVPAVSTHQEPAPGVQAGVFKEDAGWVLRSLYRRIDDLSDIVELREGMQALEDSNPSKFYAAGMWHYETGEPVGGVGSPWFQTPQDAARFMPEGVIDDTFLMAGQVERKFI